MGGKAAIFIVLGFSLIFLVYGSNFNRLTFNAVDNAVEYHNNTMARYLASSGANIAANKIFMDKTWGVGFTDLKIDGGEVNVYVSNPFYIPADGSGKITICHVPPGNPAAAHDITISQNAVAAHLTHHDGDHLGGCGASVETDIITIVAEGTYEDSTEVIVVELRPSSFAKFAYLSSVENGIWWTNKDTVWGPFHTNERLQVNGEPVFWGKVTANGKMKKYNNHADPHFYAGYDDGEYVPIPNDGVAKVKTAAEASGFKFTGKDTVYLDFVNDSLRYKYAYNEAYTTVETNTLAPNGVIFAEGADIRMQGVVDGKYTVATSTETVTKTIPGHYDWWHGWWTWIPEHTETNDQGGNIYLDDDIVYKDDPLDGNSNDILGIVAQDKIQITNNAANNNDIEIQAAMYCQEGGFGAEDYASRPVSGTIKLTGGITQYSRAAVGTFSGSVNTHGFSKRYRYDDRLMLASPPFFPGTGNFEVVSWYE